MAKQLFERKLVTNLCGVLTENNDGDFIVTVNDKDNSTDYNLNEILHECIGQIIMFKSEE